MSASGTTQVIGRQYSYIKWEIDKPRDQYQSLMSETSTCMCQVQPGRKRQEAILCSYLSYFLFFKLLGYRQFILSVGIQDRNVDELL